MRATGDARTYPLVRTVHDAMNHMLRTRLADRPILLNWPALLEYLRYELAFEPCEHLRVLHLGAGHNLIRDDIMGHGSFDHVQVSIRDLLARVIDLGSASVMLVHNHPSGDLTPSRTDIAVTRSIAMAVRLIDVALIDHVIVTRAGHASFRSLGLI